MSSTRSRNKFCLSLDNSPSNASSNTSNLNRWSEVVPPKTALTFAALWDPQEGMVTFSGAALFEPENSSETSPHPDIFEDDDLSQFISVDRDAGGSITTSENTAALTTFQDAFRAFLHCTPRDSREHLQTKSGQSTPRCMQTRASSTLDGLDIYSHDVQLKSGRSLRLSSVDLLDMESSSHGPSSLGRIRLRSDLMLDANRSEPESESTLGRRPSFLKSRFSTTTTSTSTYIDASSNPLQSMRVPETFPVPTSPTREWPQPEECASPAGSWPFLPRRRRVLRKRRPLDCGATMSATNSPPSTPRKVAQKPPIPLYPSSTLSPSATTFSLSPALALAEERRGRFPRPIGGPVTSTLTSMSTSVSTSTSTPPATPPKSPRLKLRLSFLPRRKPRQPSPDTDGWVCIDVTSIIRQRYITDLDLDED